MLLSTHINSGRLDLLLRLKLGLVAISLSVFYVAVSAAAVVNVPETPRWNSNGVANGGNGA